MDRKRRTPPRTKPSTIPLGVFTRTVGVFDPDAIAVKIAVRDAKRRTGYRKTGQIQVIRAQQRPPLQITDHGLQKSGAAALAGFGLVTGTYLSMHQ